ncbi:ABC transporter permease [Bacillus sp. FSL K6-3431]|uniref:ABC transporter permease n=1 Tax=Bacillus sp. FSL K6-3431 TaxID=2921500 RepID=UPI0030F6A802
MNSQSLLFARLRQNWKFQYGLFKAVVDWTVMLYLVIPSIVIGGAIYRSWWHDIPGWFEGIPYELLFILFFFMLWSGHFHTYVREADGIFLMKNERLLLGLKQGGIIYSYIIELLIAAALAIVIAPFWLNHFYMSKASLILFAFLWVSLKWLLMAVKGRMNIHIRGWRHLLNSLPMFIIAIIIWVVSYQAFFNGYIFGMVGIIILNMIISFIFIKKRFTTVRTFEQDLAIDELEKTKHMNLIFGMSMDIEKMPKPASTRKVPRLYSKSNRIFKKRTPAKGFLELFIKATTRNIEYILGYFKIVGVTTAAIAVLPPMWLKISLVCIGYIFLLSWISSVWHKVIVDHPFTKKYAEDDGYFHGKKVVTIALSIPFTFIIACTFIIRIWFRNLFLFF